MIKINTLQLFEGCILGTIAQSVWLLKSLIKLEEQYWDGLNYNISNTEGAYGTLSFFGKDKLFAAFFDTKSYLNPFVKSNDRYSSEDLYKSAHIEIKKIAQEDTLQYMLQNYKGKVVPLITSCFWIYKDELFAEYEWAEVYNNGAYLLKTQLITDFKIALNEWQKNYNLNETEIELVKRLFILKKSNLYAIVAIDKAIIKEIKSISEDTQLCFQHLESIKFKI